MSRNKTKRVRKRRSFTDVLLVICSIIFVFCAFYAVREWRNEADTWHRDEQALHYDLTDGRYAALAETYEDEYAGESGIPENTEEYLAVGRYYRAAVMAAACGQAFPSREAFWREEMRLAKEKMGDFVSEADRIDSILS